MKCDEVCRPKTMICNFVDNCMDGSDENLTMCIDKKLFKSLDSK